MNSAGYMFGVL